MNEDNFVDHGELKRPVWCGMTIKCKRLHEKAIVPTYKSAYASGMDLYACIESGPIPLYIAKPVIIPTGIAIEVPIGFEAQIRSRSGLAAKDNVFVLNSPGTIDCDYRGELKIILCKTYGDPFNIQHGDRIAQLVIAPVMNACQIDVVEELSNTERGTGGLGSTGV